MDFDLHIGHGGDAINLLKHILEKSNLDSETRKALETILDALEHFII
jgi:histone deacetylase complex regulatory component SIN3